MRHLQSRSRFLRCYGVGYCGSGRQRAAKDSVPGESGSATQERTDSQRWRTRIGYRAVHAVRGIASVRACLASCPSLANGTKVTTSSSVELGSSVNRRFETAILSGSSGRTRTYNPAVNSRMVHSRLTLQTRDLAKPLPPPRGGSKLMADS